MAFRIIWLTPDRFDKKRDKSTWIEMAKAFINSGHDVKILASKSQDKANTDKYITYVNAIDKPLIFRFSVLINMLFWLKKNASPSDVIIMNQDALLILPFLRMFGFRKIHLDIRTIPVDMHSTKDKLDKFLYWHIPLKWLGNKINSYSFITERLREEVEREFNLSIKDYVIWQSGVSIESFYPITQIRKPNSKFRLFYHGTISINRGIGLIIQAISLLEKEYNMEFVIVGGSKDNALEELKALTNDMSLNDRVIFKGFMPYEKMVEEISKADACICPLTDRLEWNVSSPIKVFEYMACAKPIILTPISAHKDVTNDLPFIVWTEGFEPKDFKEAIIKAINNRDQLASLADTGPNFVRNHYQWKNLAKKLEIYLEKTMNINAQIN